MKRLMKKFKFIYKLRTQIIAYYVVAILLAITMMASVLYVGISRIVVDNSMSTTHTAVNKSGTYIELYIEKLITISDMMVENPALIRYFSNEVDNKEKDVEDVLSLIDTTLETDPYIESIIIVSKDGKIISNESDLDMTMSKDMMEEQWYVSAINSENHPILTSARMQKFSMDKDKWVISVSQEISDSKGDNLGVLLIDIDYSVIEDYLKDLDLGSEGYAFIVNANNEIVFHEDTAYFQEADKQMALISVVSKIMEDGMIDDYVASQYNLDNTDWTLVGVCSVDELDEVKAQLISIFIWTGSILLILVIIGGAFFAARITNPIRKLEHAMTDIEESLHQIDVTEEGCYEARSLAKHFNIMVDKIKLLMDDISTKEKSIRTYEINVLHSQINPHFLYNTLDTIVWMAEFGDSEKVIEITKALASFFRLSLSGGQELTTIENELGHVAHYLFIQKQRYGEDLRYNIENDESISDIKIPKIILQPIVENAIYHGIRGTGKKGIINIKAIQEGEDILFVIKDNGKGFDTSSLNDHRQKENDQVKLGGVGINNVDKRIKLYYGESYGATIKSVIGEFTQVTIRVASSIIK